MFKLLIASILILPSQIIASSGDGVLDMELSAEDSPTVFETSLLSERLSELDIAGSSTKDESPYGRTEHANSPHLLKVTSEVIRDLKECIEANRHNQNDPTLFVNDYDGAKFKDFDHFISFMDEIYVPLFGEEYIYPESGRFQLVLDLSFKHFGILDFQDMSCRIGSLPFTSLNLAMNKCSCCVAVIARMISHTTLDSLNLSCCRLAPGEEIDFGRMLLNTTIYQLDIHGNFLHHRFASLIGLVLKDITLEALNISGNEVMDHGAALIANALPDSQLSSLTMSNCEIGDEAADSLMSILPSTKITHLDLRRNAFSVGKQVKLIDFGKKNVIDIIV